MTNTTHYNMTIAEGTDIVNPLTQIFPNFNTIDSAMFANKGGTVGTATEVTTGTVHAIVRNNPDADVFRFTATSAWTAGDTMTLDGNGVIVHLSDGTTPITGSYIIGAEVFAVVNAGLVTLMISSNGGVTSFNGRTGAVTPAASDYTAAEIDFDNTNVDILSTDLQGATEEIANKINDLSSWNLVVNGSGSAAGATVNIGSQYKFIAISIVDSYGDTTLMQPSIASIATLKTGGIGLISEFGTNHIRGYFSGNNFVYTATRDHKIYVF